MCSEQLHRRARLAAQNWQSFWLKQALTAQLTVGTVKRGMIRKILPFFHCAQENRIFRHMLAITAAAAKPTMWHTFHSMCDTTVVVMITSSGESDTEPTIYRAGTFFFSWFFLHSFLTQGEKNNEFHEGLLFFSFLHGFLSRQ